jgi:sulfoacetaldehyde acetyltransferase
VAEGCGLKGITVDNPSDLTQALAKAIEDQANGVTTFVEVVLNQELGEPFRRDAMKKPVPVAGIQRPSRRSSFRSTTARRRC